MKKYRIHSMLLVLMVFILMGCGSSENKKNEKALIKVLKSVPEGETTFEELVPFSWDKLYTFPPYASKEQIEKVLGFSSKDIEENMVNEGLTYLLFVKDNEVVCNFFGYSDYLGFSVNFGVYDEYVEITNGENTPFTVTKEEGIPYFTMGK